jgi:hypothetical protein
MEGQNRHVGPRPKGFSTAAITLPHRGLRSCAAPSAKCKSAANRQPSGKAPDPYQVTKRQFSSQIIFLRSWLKQYYRPRIDHDPTACLYHHSTRITKVRRSLQAHRPSIPSRVNHGFCRVSPNPGADFRGGRRPPPLRGDHRPISFELPSARWTAASACSYFGPLPYRNACLVWQRVYLFGYLGNVSISEACAVACVCDRH